MRTAEEIVSSIDNLINSMLHRPLMYGDSPLSLEGMVLSLIKLYRSSTNASYSPRTDTAWTVFARQCLGDEYVGSLPVSRFLKETGILDDEWTQLTSMLQEFYDTQIKNK